MMAFQKGCPGTDAMMLFTTSRPPLVLRLQHDVLPQQRLLHRPEALHVQVDVEAPKGVHEEGPQRIPCTA